MKHRPLANHHDQGSTAQLTAAMARQEATTATITRARPRCKDTSAHTLTSVFLSEGCYQGVLLQGSRNLQAIAGAVLLTYTSTCLVSISNLLTYLLTLWVSYLLGNEFLTLVGTTGGACRPLLVPVLPCHTSLLAHDACRELGQPSKRGIPQTALPELVLFLVTVQK